MRTTWKRPASAEIRLAAALARLWLTDMAPLAGVEYFLRVIYALLADQEGGVLLHAAGLLTPADGRVRLFIGRSGSGKSTVAALSPHAIVLNDDLALLRQDAAGRWIAYGTPFWNPETLTRSGETASGPVAGIYRLAQDREVYLEPLSPATAAAELAANCPVINGDLERLPGLLARCRRLVADVPVQRLHFRKDPSFWDVL